MQLRDYQQEAIDKVRKRLWVGVNRQIVKMATGLGKTPLFASLPEQLGFSNRMLVLVHREELARQAMDKLRQWNPDRSVGLEMGQYTSNGEQLVVAGVQTIGKSGSTRLAKFTPGDFDGVVCDEAHHATAQTYQTIFNHFRVFEDKHRLLLGVSATLNRADGRGLGEVFQEIVDDKDVLWGIRHGWLADLKGIRVKTATSLDGVHTQAGDFNQGELSDEINTPYRNELIVRAWLEKGQDRQTVAYCVDVQHAKDLAFAFKKYGVCCEAIWGGDPDRQLKLELHQQGKLKVLCNCELLTEGYDDWRISCILMARPTQSQGLYTQIVGRGTRIPTGIVNLNEARASGIPIPKSDCLLIDVVDNTKRHSLVNLPTLYGMDQEMDLKGRSLVEVVDEIEELTKVKPYVNITNCHDIDQLKSYAEEVDLFQVTFPPEVVQISEYQWHRTSSGSYVLLLAEGESVGILPDDIGNWHIRGTVNGHELDQVKQSFEDAIKEADYKVFLHGGRNLRSLVKRFSKWHKEAPTDAQKIACKWNKLKIPTGATRGEVAMKLNWVIGEKLRKKGKLAA